MNKTRQSDNKTTLAVMCRRVFAGILSLAIILTMLPMMSLKVSAASPTSVKIYGGNTVVEMVSSEEKVTYWKNRARQLGGSEADYNAKYDSNTNTLTLRNFSTKTIGGAATSIYANGDLNIVLEGENKIGQLFQFGPSVEKGIYIEKGSLTISGKGKLEIISEMLTNTNLAFDSIYVSKDITIKGGAKVSIQAIKNQIDPGYAPDEHETLCAKNGNVTISGEDTIVSVDNIFGYAINAKDGQGQLIVADGATVTAYGPPKMNVFSITTASGYQPRCAYGENRMEVRTVTGSVPAEASKNTYVRIAPQDTVDVRTLEQLKEALNVSADDASTKINVLNDITVTEELTAANSTGTTKAVTIRGENSAKLIRDASYTGTMLKLTNPDVPITLKDIAIDGNKVTAKEAAIWIDSSSELFQPILTLDNGAVVENCTGDYGYSAIQVGRRINAYNYTYGYLKVQDGSAIRNNVYAHGINILEKARVDMEGGTISGNDSDEGAGVCNDGTFNLSGGKITGNTGMGIYSIGELNITGGEITKNGGGVQYQAGTFTMSGGSITDNTGTYGAGVQVVRGGTDGTLKLSGNVKISGNTTSSAGSLGEPENVYLCGADSRIQITGALGDDAQIGVKSRATSENGMITFASGEGYVIADSDVAKFTSDMTDWTVERNTDNTNEINLKRVKTTLIPGDFTFTAPADKVYDGTKKEAVVTKNGTACGTITVKYYDGDGNVVEPINAGTYDVRIDVAENGEYKAATGMRDATWRFTITKKPLAVSVADTEVELGDTLPTLNVNVTGFADGESETTLTGFEKPTATPETTVDTTTIGKKNFTVKYSGGNATANYTFDLSNTTATANVTSSDTTAPVISGVEEGKTYCIEISKVTVTDTKLKEVTLNGVTQTVSNGKCEFAVSPKDGTQTIIAKDLAGNTTTMTFTVNNGHTPGPAATEDTAQKCIVCGDTITPPLGHVHKNHLTKVSAKPAACEKDGNKEYYQCSCGLMFADSTAASEVTQADIRIPQTGHQFATTYTHDGNNHWYACTNPGCTAVSGKEAHTPEADDGDCTTAVKCSVCGGTAIAAKQHDYGKTYQSNDKEHWQICKNAGCTHQTAKTKHTAGDWIVDTKATVEKEGSRHKECSICGYVMKTESIAKLIQYKVLEGADETVISHKDESLTLRADGEYPKFVSIEVDGKVVDSKYYTAWSGSTYVKFTKEFMDSLSVGHHTIRFNFTDGYAMTNLTVAKEGTTQSTPANTDASITSPQTGENPDRMLFAGILSLMMAGILAGMKAGRKNNTDR